MNSILQKLSRRAFLVGLGAALLGLRGTSFGDEGVNPELERFRNLSAELTGFEPAQLELKLARSYRDSLSTTEPVSLSRLIRAAGEVPSLEHMQSSGVFEDRELADVANKIIELWYTGVYPTDSGSRVATYGQALAWQCLEFAHPPSYCGPPWWTSLS